MPKTATKAKSEVLPMQGVTAANLPAKAKNGKVEKMGDLNTSGYRAYDQKVIIRMDEPMEKAEYEALRLRQDQSGLYIPDSVKNQQKKDYDNAKFAELTGTIVHMGCNAFAEAEDMATRRGKNPDTPQVGDRVAVARYAGVFFPADKTADGEEYRMLNDEDVIGFKDF